MPKQDQLECMPAPSDKRSLIKGIFRTNGLPSYDEEVRRQSFPSMTTVIIHPNTFRYPRRCSAEHLIASQLTKPTLLFRNPVLCQCNRQPQMVIKILATAEMMAIEPSVGEPPLPPQVSHRGHPEVHEAPSSHSDYLVLSVLA